MSCILSVTLLRQTLSVERYQLLLVKRVLKPNFHWGHDLPQVIYEERHSDRLCCLTTTEDLCEVSLQDILLEEVRVSFCEIVYRRWFILPTSWGTETSEVRHHEGWHWGCLCDDSHHVCVKRIVVDEDAFLLCQEDKDMERIGRQVFLVSLYLSFKVWNEKGSIEFHHEWKKSVLLLFLGKHWTYWLWSFWRTS